MINKLLAYRSASTANHTQVISFNRREVILPHLTDSSARLSYVFHDTRRYVFAIDNNDDYLPSASM